MRDACEQLAIASKAAASASLMDATESVRFDAAGASVSGLWTHATRPIAAAAIAHGAGAGLSHPFMAGVAEALAAGGISVLRFNFPYMESRPRFPDAAPVLLDAWTAAIQQVSRPDPALPVVAGGKSLGGRMASMLAAAQGHDFRGVALVFFGYPLHAPGNTDRLRDAHLPQIRVPMLFIQGTRDSLARLDLVEALVARLHPLARLHVVTGGDHSFRVPGTKRPDRETALVLGRVAADYIRDIVATRPPQVR
jgi:uncharacterized protein